MSLWVTLRPHESRYTASVHPLSPNLVAYISPSACWPSPPLLPVILTPAPTRRKGRQLYIFDACRPCANVRILFVCLDVVLMPFTGPRFTKAGRGARVEVTQILPLGLRCRQNGSYLLSPSFMISDHFHPCRTTSIAC